LDVGLADATQFSGATRSMVTLPDPRHRAGSVPTVMTRSCPLGAADGHWPLAAASLAPRAAARDVAAHAAGRAGDAAGQAPQEAHQAVAIVAIRDHDLQVGRSCTTSLRRMIGGLKRRACRPDAGHQTGGGGTSA
jgi:hypothetical protein